MFEHHREGVLPRRHFVRRLAGSALLALGLVVFSLLLGMLGYHFIAHLAWVDAFLDASMILSGMGPVNPLDNNAGKIFAGCYALFSGIVFLSTAAIVFAPLAHRLLHRFHVPTEQDEEHDARSRKKK